MVFRGPVAPKAMSAHAYERACTGNGISYNERRKERISCSICGKEMAKGSLQRHMIQQHNLKPENYLYTKKGTEKVFRISVKRGENNRCPIPGCPGGSKDKFGMYRHFCARHNDATIIIREDARLKRCELCGMFTANVQKHQTTKTCMNFRRRRENEQKQNNQAKADEVSFTVYGKNLERVREFKYLGRILREDDDDTSSIMQQVKRARSKWNSIAKVLKREGACAKTMAKFYLAVVQAVLL